MDCVENPEIILQNIYDWLTLEMGYSVSKNKKLKRIMVKGKGIKEGYQIIFYNNVLETYKKLKSARLLEYSNKYKMIQSSCKENLSTQVLSLTAMGKYNMADEESFLAPLQTYLLINYGVMLGTILVCDGQQFTVRYVSEFPLNKEILIK